MKRRVTAVLLAGLFALAAASPVLADGNNPNNSGGNQTGYEGQPGNNPTH
jgi:opacity protein-like surface antigen